MKKLIFCFLFSCLFLLQSCLQQEESSSSNSDSTSTPSTLSGTIQFQPQGLSSLLSQEKQGSNSPFLKATSAGDAKTLILTIKTQAGDMVHEHLNLNLENFGGTLITTPLDLAVGQYQLTEFLVLDGSGDAIYATPVLGSAKDYLVNSPLSISFEIKKDEVTTLIPQVISIADATPLDFGYASFRFDVVDILQFRIVAFVYEESTKSFILTDAQLEVLDTTGDSLYNQALEAKTSLITVQKRGSYQIKVTKSGYLDYSSVMSSSQLEASLSSPVRVVFRVDGSPSQTVEKTTVAGYHHTCTLFESGVVKCWGYNGHGELGLGHTAHQGDGANEMGDSITVGI